MGSPPKTMCVRICRNDSVPAESAGSPLGLPGSKVWTCRNVVNQNSVQRAQKCCSVVTLTQVLSSSHGIFLFINLGSFLHLWETGPRKNLEGRLPDGSQTAGSGSVSMAQSLGNDTFYIFSYERLDLAWPSLISECQPTEHSV